MLSREDARLSRRPTSDQVAQRVRSLMWNGELRPGDRIVLDALCEELGVSRIPVREALLDLARDGTVVAELHVGFFVGEFDPSVVHDHLEMFGRLQAMAGQRVAERGDPAVIDDLQARCRDLVAEPDPARVEQITFEIHRSLHKAAGSTRLRAVLRELGRMFPAGVFAAIPGSAEVQKETLPPVIDAVARPSPEEIEAACLAAGRIRADLIVAHLEETGVFQQAASA